MSGNVIPALIDAGAAIIGGAINKKSADKANKLSKQQMAQDQINFDRSMVFNREQAAESRRQAEIQQWNWEREHFYGIQDRVKSARAAGLHPLFALGLGSGSGSSGGGFIPGQAPTGSFASQGFVDSNLGASVAEAGRSLSRAFEKPSEAEQHQAALQELFAIEQLREMRSRTALNEAEAMRLSSEVTTGTSAALAGGRLPGSAANPLVASPNGSVEIEPLTGYAPKSVNTPLGWLDRSPLQGEGYESAFGEGAGGLMNALEAVKSVAKARGRELGWAFDLYKGGWSSVFRKLGIMK